MDQALGEEKRELLEEYEEKGDLLTRFQELLMKNAEMEEKVSKADERLMRLRTQLEETTVARELLESDYEEFNEQWKGSGNGASHTDSSLNLGIPAVRFPLAEEGKPDDSMSGEVMSYLRSQGAALWGQIPT